LDSLNEVIKIIVIFIQLINKELLFEKNLPYSILALLTFYL